MRGRLIVFEGIDGSGKGTQINLLKEHLLARGEDVVLMSSITDSPEGKAIRLALNGTDKTISDDKLFFLFNIEQAAIQSQIKEHLSNGKTILIDRYYYSTLAYYHRVNENNLMEFLGLVSHLTPPDLVIYLYISPETALARISKNRGKTERFESIEKLTKVSLVYDKLLDTALGINRQTTIYMYNGELDMDTITSTIQVDVSAGYRHKE